MTTLELPGQTADPAVKNKGGRKPGDPRNTGSKPKLTIKCWWGCGATVYHGILREHWMQCPLRPEPEQGGRR
jgi:hypothetical protein